MAQNLSIDSKLPNVKTTIFTVMSALANEHKAVNLGQGFPEFDGDEFLKTKVCHYLQNGMNQYSPMTGQAKLRSVLSNKLLKLYGHKFNEDTEITVTSGATEAIFNAISALVDQGDEVIIFDPAYDCYEPVIDLMKAKCVHIPLLAPDFQIDWNLVKSKINDKTKMIILNTPQNPTGTLLTQEDINTLADLTENKNIIILSDEVYEHIIFDGHKHICLAAEQKLAHKTLSVFSFGKTFHTTGWKIGYIIGPEYLMKEINKVHQYNTFCTPTPMQLGIADMLEQNPNYVHELGPMYQKKRDFFLNGLKGTKFKPYNCLGTYFLLADYSEVSDLSDTEFANWLTIEHGVTTIPISVFYADKPDQKIVRFCFAKNEDTMQLAIDKLSEV